jgi:hypothetical protein
MIDLPFIRRIRFWYFVSAFPFTSRYWLLHGSPRPCCLVFPLVSFPFLASGYLCLVPHLHDPGSFSSPYACVSLQLLSRCPLRYLQFFRFIRRGLCVHRRSSLSPISFRISVLPPRFRGSVFVARESRRSALTPRTLLFRVPRIHRHPIHRPLRSLLHFRSPSPRHYRHHRLALH